jgi:hypothetical protein
MKKLEIEMVIKEPLQTLKQKAIEYGKYPNTKYPSDFKVTLFGSSREYRVYRDNYTSEYFIMYKGKKKKLKKLGASRGYFSI